MSSVEITMGCFHQTDLLTNLPIRAGDPVRALVLTPWVAETCHLPFGPAEPTHRYQPVCLPLSGTYNDYGWLREVAEDVGAATLRRYFAEAHQMSDLSLDDLDDTLVALNQAAQQRDRRKHGDVAVAEEVPETDEPVIINPRYYGVTMMHERTYQALLAATRSYREWDGAVGEEVDAQIAAFRAAIEPQPQGIRFSPDYESATVHAAMSAHHHLTMSVAGRAIFTSVAEGRNDETVLAAARDFLLLINGLHLGRISLQPTCGQGGQYAAYAIHTALFLAGQELAAQEEAEDEGDDEGDDEDEAE
jgi:hypothetical protein